MKRKRDFVKRPSFVGVGEGGGGYRVNNFQSLGKGERGSVSEIIKSHQQQIALQIENGKREIQPSENQKEEYQKTNPPSTGLGHQLLVGRGRMLKKG